jgi:hypothetical protein
MADYTQTASAVLASASATITSHTAGAAIAAGEPCYLDTADLDSLSRPKAKLADANASATTATVHGLALNTASAGQPVSIVREDADFTHGLTGATIGDIVILSANAGKLAPAADLAGGWFPVVCLIVTSATKGILKITQGTVAKA